MNYIKHLSGFFNRIVFDTDLNPTHVSLYMALFQSWNLNRFQNPISITRNEVMRISKIFSKATYHKCVNELHNKGYINYEPSHNPFKGSLVWVIELDVNALPLTKKDQRSSKIRQPTEHPIEQLANNYQTSTSPTPRQALVPSINSINNSNNSNSENGHAFENKEIPKNNFQEEKKKKFSQKKEIFEIIPPKLEDVRSYFMSQNIDANEAERFFNHFQSNGWLVGGKSKMKNWQASAKNWIMNLQSFTPIQVAAATPVPGNLKTSNQKKYDEPL
ncbi:transcriptional regulator [Flavobacterium myungsuense]|uniref:Transcriptional regulator n=2 Tax=Flavobacterium myungsuense TaxID=651823 RepID=A0ABW3J295_9FLAO